MAFNGESTTDNVLEGVRLDGQHAVVTGATGGLGIETARALASVGASVTITGRSPEKIEAALKTLRHEVPEAQFDSEELELASQASVAAATKRIVDSERPIHLLINNAGVMMCPEGQTDDGFETQFGTNHLGHFAWTAGLLPSIAPGARVVTLSSGAHVFGTCDVDDLNWQKRDYEPRLAYAQSKTANLWFGSELQRRHGDRLLSLSVHPGVIQTDLSRHVPQAILDTMRASFVERGVQMKSVPQGAATSVWAATSDALLNHGGAYLADCQVAEPVSAENAASGYAPWAYDTENAERLWSESERLTGLTFG
ncbi:MAG: SDR family NAD(P)-dependent oxidoreductase [Myxococcota bacterium]|nr:SDR family NAD(P)-dependent oxidoreductase [Myxococcota bacterium]